MKAKGIDKPYDEVAWRAGAGGMLVPGGDVGPDGESGITSGERLPPEYRVHHVNVHAFNSLADGCFRSSERTET